MPCAAGSLRFLVKKRKGSYIHQPLVSIRPTRLEDWFSWGGGGQKYTQGRKREHAELILVFDGYKYVLIKKQIERAFEFECTRCTGISAAWRQRSSQWGRRALDTDMAWSTVLHDPVKVGYDIRKKSLLSCFRRKRTLIQTELRENRVKDEYFGSSKCLYLSRSHCCSCKGPN